MEGRNRGKSGGREEEEEEEKRTLLETLIGVGEGLELFLGVGLRHCCWVREEWSVLVL